MMPEVLLMLEVLPVEVVVQADVDEIELLRQRCLGLFCALAQVPETGMK